MEKVHPWWPTLGLRTATEKKTEQLCILWGSANKHCVDEHQHSNIMKADEVGKTNTLTSSV